MRVEIKMPDVATTESEIRIVRWIVQLGEKAVRGKPLVEVETDKATVEVESVATGVLCEVRSRPGEPVAVGDVIAVVEVEQAATAAPAPAAPVSAAAAAAAIAAPVATGPAARPAARPGGMFARNRAAADVKAAAGPAKADPVQPTASGVALSVAQRTAARRLQASKQTIPHFYLQTSFSAEAIVAHRRDAGARPPAWDAFLVLAVARALGRFERFRCRLDGERLVPAGTAAIGVAIDSDGELYVIPVEAAAGKTVAGISDEIRRAAERLRGGDQDLRRTRPALITVTNLGMCHVERFIPIINPPEPAILGAGKVQLTPVARGNGELGVEHRGTLTLCVDHRVASGKYAADFLGAIVAELEAMR